MDVLEYQDIDDTELVEVNLACFGHTHSKKRLQKMIKADRRLPEWGGELYAVEDDRVLGVVGLLYPKARIGEDIMDVGGIRNVCTRPSASRSGVAKKLIKEAHDILRDSADYSFLMTSASNVAHDLYRNLGYEDIHTAPKAFKTTENVRSDIRFKEEKDPDYVRSVYMDSVKKLKGLVVREKDFWDMAEARGWPKNDAVKIAYKDGKRIGYAMFNTFRDRLSVTEIGAEDGLLPDILDGLECRTEKDHIVLSYVNPVYKELIEERGYRWTRDLWSKVMVKDLKKKGPNLSEGYWAEDSFHMGLYESY